VQGLRNVPILLLLLALTVLVYLPVLGLEFVNYDDTVYVTENPRVSRGLTWEGFVWSLGAFENGNWHPVTLLSHMLDVRLFGLRPAGHHLVSLALHVVNALLLYSLLAWTTSRPWPSALVAALFAVHPLNLQTVAWVAERKSLLSTAFWLLALLAHARRRERPAWRWSVAVTVCAALALASKPMAVMLPLTLFLFDLWPLGTEPVGPGSRLLRYVRELAPVVALAGLCGILTLEAQHAARALQTVDSYPWSVRLGNAAVAYVWYLGKLLWPSGLAVFYPHPGATLPTTTVVASAGILLVLATAVVWKGRTVPFLGAGFWWYAGTLLPVAGIVQVGSQACADRYAYVPLVGIFIVLAWTAAKAVESSRPAARTALAVAFACWVVGLSLTTRAQIPFWQDSVSLFQRAVDVVPENALAHNNLGMAFVERNRITEAAEQFRLAVDLAPWDTDARSNLGNALRALGRPRDALVEYHEALDQKPDDPTIHYNLATALLDLGRLDEATGHLIEAVRIDPDYQKARRLLGTLQERRAPAGP